MNQRKKLKLKKVKVKKVATGRGRLVIFSGFNNTIFTITHENGEKIEKNNSSRTATGYSGARKATPWAAQEAAKKTLARLEELGISSVEITVKGMMGSGWNAALKTIRGASDKLRIEKIEGKIALPFNGCRPKASPRK